MLKVSVILTTYNSGENLQKTMISILNQEGNKDLFEIELLVIDDCSTDNTLEIVERFNIRTFSTNLNSGGPNKGRNIGLKEATGDYICIADHDDIWHENKIISLLPYLRKVPIVSSGFTIINSKNKEEISRIAKVERDFLFFKKNETFLNLLVKNSGQNTYLGSLIFDSKLKYILFEENFGIHQ